MYDGLEIGQSGEVTLVEGELYSFIIQSGYKGVYFMTVFRFCMIKQILK